MYCRPSGSRTSVHLAIRDVEEVPTPRLLARIEQSLVPLGLTVVAENVPAFVIVASRTSPNKVRRHLGEIRREPPRDDVFRMEAASPYRYRT